MKQPEQTRESQYSVCLDVDKVNGRQRFGIMANQAWHDDPRRLAFTCARYKFASKMLSGKSHVLEVGCADAFGTRIVRQEVGSLTAIDFDPIFVNDAKETMSMKWNYEVLEHDILSKPVTGAFDGAYSLDVLEHISATQEDDFLRNVSSSLTDDGVLIIGMPSLESQQYASPQSKDGHVNLQVGK